jgi:hypothetical protein
VGGLLAIPLAVFAARRLWAALVLGASLCILTLVLVPPLFTALSDARTLSQARRLPQFLPLAIAVVGGCAVLSRLRGGRRRGGRRRGPSLRDPLLQLRLRASRSRLGGSCGRRRRTGRARRRRIRAGSCSYDNRFWLAAMLAFVLPSAVAGLAGVEKGARTARSRSASSRRCARMFPPETSPSRIDEPRTSRPPTRRCTSTPPRPHTAETRENQLVPRARDARRFFDDRSLSDAVREGILERWGPIGSSSTSGAPIRRHSCNVSSSCTRTAALPSTRHTVERQWRASGGLV